MPFSSCREAPRDLLSFPTRRSSDLVCFRDYLKCAVTVTTARTICVLATAAIVTDRKSTRLNSSPLGISYAVFFMPGSTPGSTLFPYTTLFRSCLLQGLSEMCRYCDDGKDDMRSRDRSNRHRSEEHTSELQSLRHLVCRFLHAGKHPGIYSLSLHDALPILFASGII